MIKPGSHLAVGADDLVANLDLALLHVPNMQDVSVEYLNVGHLKIGLAVDGKRTGIILLSTGFGVKVGLVEEDPEHGPVLQLRCGVDELGALVDPLDGSVRVAQYYVHDKNPRSIPVAEQSLT